MVCSGSLAAKSGKNIFTKSVYFNKTVVRALSWICKVILALQKGWIFRLRLIKKVTYNSNISLFRSRAVATNYFLLTSLTHLLFQSALIVI